mgnify:CR=1 FL=1
MQGFILFMAGIIIGIFITAITQANRNAQDRERAEHAIKQAKKYREFIEKNNIGGFRK